MTMVEVTDSGVVPLVYADGEDESSGPGDSVVQVMVGDQLYPASFRQQCRVCQSPHRGYIEAEIARGTFYASIERSMDGWNTGTLPPPSARSMGNHMASFHAPLTQVIKRKQMEQVYEKSGGEIDEAADHHVNRVVVAHAIIKRYHDQMAADEKEKVTTADLALANRIVEEHEKNYGQDGISEEMWRNAMYAYMDILAPEIAPERRESVTRAIENHPAMRAIAEANRKAQAQHGDTVQGEVLD